MVKKKEIGARADARTRCQARDPKKELFHRSIGDAAKPRPADAKMGSGPHFF
jgi:hypothetical protein